MIIAELPVDEELRLIDLESYNIMDSGYENEFDELVELAAQVCKTPISLISLLDRDRKWFKAKKGLGARETSKEVAFCAHAILQEGVMEVPDATKDTRFADNPLVTGDLNIRFYAGAPIISSEGHKLGTLCIIDNKPRNISPEEERTLTILSNQMTKLLELRKKNILLRQRAEEMIALKTTVINKVIRQKEEDKKSIANKLHEDLAQSLAAGMMYLKMSREHPGSVSPFMETATQQFSDVLTGMRNLSYDITPAAVNWIPAEELVKEFVEKIAGTYSFDLRFKIRGEKSNCRGDKAIIAIRIIEEWLKVLANKKVSKVTITIQTQKDFELLIEDKGPSFNFEATRKEVFESSAFDMAQSQGGRIDLSISKSAKNIFKLALPLAAAMAELAF